MGESTIGGSTVHLFKYNTHCIQIEPHGITLMIVQILRCIMCKFNVYIKLEIFCTDLLRKMTTQVVVMTVAIITMKIKATADIVPPITPELSELSPGGSKTWRPAKGKNIKYVRPRNYND